MTMLISVETVWDRPAVLAKCCIIKCDCDRGEKVISSRNDAGEDGCLCLSEKSDNDCHVRVKAL